jgi:large subunit ribosomal protein L23
MLSTEIIKRPIISEKTMLLAEQQNKYTFSVDKRANKVQIKKAIEEIFKVTVVKVNKIVSNPKKRRYGQYLGFKPEVVKAIVTLKDGDKIAIFEA